VTGGPWRSITDSLPEPVWQRPLTRTASLYVWQEDVSAWDWTAMGLGRGLGAGGEAPTSSAAMEAADLWASENGYPAVRVDVDP
jgi:hypothetical protein